MAVRVYSMLFLIKYLCLQDYIELSHMLQCNIEFELSSREHFHNIFHQIFEDNFELNWHLDKYNLFLLFSIVFFCCFFNSMI